ncbi:MAG: ribonucleotide-diphosphate reductase subunit beta [Nitrososphaerota archaeon]
MSEPGVPSVLADDGELDLDRDTAPTIDYIRLYRLWEESNWSAYGLDFAQDIVDWREHMSPEQRAAARWNYSLFLQGEEAVARTLAPFVQADLSQEQRVFITTQIVDEARHHVFFSRFMREVVGDGQDLATTLDAAQVNLTPGFRKVFGELDHVTDRLRRQPHNRALLARSILLYHIVVEGLLAHPGQHFMRQSLAARNLLPGFAAGIAHIARDESRHMAFGIQALAELVAESRLNRQAAIAELDRVMPWAVAVFVPPSFDENYIRVFGIEPLDLFAFALRSLTAKLRRIGIEPGEVPALVKLGADLPPEEQASRTVRLLHAGVLSSDIPLAMDDEVTALLFDGLERLANMRPSAPLPGAIQWEFADASPWYLTPDGSQLKARQGQADNPVLVLRCTLADWARIAGKQLNPRWAVATRRLRMSGDLRVALRLPALLGA